MRYISTRGQAEPISFEQAALEPTAPGGGLRIPEYYPSISEKVLRNWRRLSYPALAAQVIRLYWPEIPMQDLIRLCHKTYTAESFSHSRNGGNPEHITPLTWLEKDVIGLLELANGPTWAFKDVALQFLGNVLEYILKKNGGHLNILGATSGDTGSAAIAGVRGKDNITITIMHPHGRVSDVQERQLTTVLDTNVHSLALGGTFDDSQRTMKTVFQDRALVDRLHLGAVNSTNWVRIIAQTVYYIWGYLRATDNVFKPVVFSIPTGNFGDAFAGHVAQQMGLPIYLHCATNENDPVARLINNGYYDPNGSGAVQETDSPSMDIESASNAERIVADACDRDGQRVQQLFTGGPFDISRDPMLSRIRDNFGFSATSTTHVQRIAAIRSIHGKYGIVIDTHTAAAIAALLDMPSSIPKDAIWIALETALWFKFEPVIREALGDDTPDLPQEVLALMDKEQHFQIMAPDVDAIKNHLEEISIQA